MYRVLSRPSPRAGVIAVAAAVAASIAHPLFCQLTRSKPTLDELRAPTRLLMRRHIHRLTPLPSPLDRGLQQVPVLHRRRLLRPKLQHEVLAEPDRPVELRPVLQLG